MIEFKSFFITGEVKTYNGVQQRTLAEALDKVLNDFSKKNQGIKVVDLKTNVQFGGQDIALVTVLYEQEHKKPEIEIRKREK